MNITNTNPLDIEFANPLTTKNQRILTLSNNNLTNNSSPNINITKQTKNIDTIKLKYPINQLIHQKTNNTNE